MTLYHTFQIEMQLTLKAIASLSLPLSFAYCNDAPKSYSCVSLTAGFSGLNADLDQASVEHMHCPCLLVKTQSGLSKSTSHEHSYLL